MRTLILAALFVAGVAQAQNGTPLVTLTAQQDQAQGSLAPVLNWVTTPAGATCAASGGWSGTKPASGSETLPAISVSTAYTLECQWPAVTTGRVAVSVTRPTTNTDGTPLTNLAGYRFLWGPGPDNLPHHTYVMDPALTRWESPALASGQWYFAARAVNDQNTESVNSALHPKTIPSVPAQTARATTSVTILTAPPSPPVISVVPLTAGANVAPVFTSAGTFAGMAPVGTPCGERLFRYAGLDLYRPEQWTRVNTRISLAATVGAPCGPSS